MIMPKETAEELPSPDAIVRLGYLLAEVPSCRPNRTNPMYILPDIVQGQMNNYWNQPDKSDFAIIFSREYTGNDNDRMEPAAFPGQSLLISRGISVKRQWNVRTIRFSQ